MARLTNKKIKKAKTVYDIYCKVNSLAKVREATGLGINTIRRYIAIVEDLDNRSKLSTKDRYYNNSSNTINTSTEAPPPCNSTYNNSDISSCQAVNKNNLEIDNINRVGQIGTERDDMDVILANNVPDLKETKNKILASKLDHIAFKYLEYLDNPKDDQLLKLSLKDTAVIAGILLDKKIFLEHKNADVVKNQSIIFNLFGDNAKLAEFISSSMARQKALKERPVNKYIPAVNK